MTTAHLNPPTSWVETIEETLTRLSANIATLTGIIDEAERRGRIHLAGVFTAARTTVVAEARKKIARARAVSAAHSTASDRGLRGPVPVGNLPLQPEVRQWQRAVNEGWPQGVV